MIGGLLVDLIVVAAVAAFAWGAAQIGGIASLGRLVEVAAAVAAAALLRDPAGSVVRALLGTSVDFSRLLGMLLVALGTWIAVHSVYRWWRARRAAARADDDGVPIEDAPDRLDAVLVARVAGAVLGLGWALLFVALFVLQPSSNVASRAAVASRTGGLLIRQEHVLRWLRDGFPHYTQTLPKGSLGAVVGEHDRLPMRDPVGADPRPRDADGLLRAINEYRGAQRVQVLAFNPDVAGVARRHGVELVQARTLSHESPNGGSIDQRVLAALGEAVGSFDDEVGIEVAWAHDPATAMRGLLDSSRARSLLSDERWSEIGIGAVYAGWFNGRVYVLLLVGPAED